jgi:hypothetical protein
LNLDTNGNDRKLMATFAMAALGVVLLALIGEAAKFFMPHDALYYFLIDKIYILAAAIFLLLLGLNRVNANSIRDLTAIFVLLLFGQVVLWQLDKVLSGVLWNGLYPSVYGRIPANYVTVTMQSLDVVGIVVGAIGAFLVLLKALDMAKDKLAEVPKNN